MHFHTHQKRLTKKINLLKWMEIHAFDIRTWAESRHNSLGQVIRGIGALTMALARVCNRKQIYWKIIHLLK